MQINRLADRLGEWLSGTGPDSDVVISSRIRLARNLERFNFPARLTGEQREECGAHIREKVLEAGLVQEDGYFPLADYSPLQRHFLVERHLISREQEDGEPGRGVAIGDQEVLSVMVLEEDHLRLQILKSGFQPEETWRIATGVDDMLEKQLDYAFNPQLGYLTSCPTNVGTGLRVSVMLHLPGLAMTGGLDEIVKSVPQMGLTVRGYYGENSEFLGDFYQVSNEVTLGKAETEILQMLRAIVDQVIRKELRARRTLFQKKLWYVEDVIWRAFAVLTHARILSSKEAFKLLSPIRLGIEQGYFSSLSHHALNRLIVSVQPAHIQLAEGNEYSVEQRDVARARFLRNAFDRLDARN